MLIIVFPISNVDVSIKIYQSTKAMIYSVLPPAIISSSIRINLDTSTIFFIIKPFSFIQILILISYQFPKYSVDISIIRLPTPIKFLNIIQYPQYSITMKFRPIYLQIISKEFVLSSFHTKFHIGSAVVGFGTATLVEILCKFKLKKLINFVHVFLKLNII